MKKDRQFHKSISGRLILRIACVLCAVFLLIFFVIYVINYRVTLKKEEQNSTTYLANTMMIVDDKLKDMSRVSLMTMADERTIEIIENYSGLDPMEKWSADRYLRAFYSSLVIIRNDICGIYIIKDEDGLIFRYDESDSSVRRSGRETSIAEIVAGMEQEPMLIDNCRLIIDRQPSFMRYTGEYAEDPYHNTCVWMVRDIYTFSPHEKIAQIVLIAPVDMLRRICASTLSQDRFYILTTQSGKVISSENADELLTHVDFGALSQGSAQVMWNGAEYYATCITSPQSGLKLVVGRSMRSIRAESFGFFRYYMLSCALALLAAVLITTHYVRKITRPVRELADTMEAFDRDSMNFRCAVRTQDEMGRLASAFNGMLDIIQNQIEKEYIAQARLRESQLKEQNLTMLYLKNQINPHFLYNTLDTIRIGAQLRGDQEAADLLMKLVSFCRLSMRFNQSVVTLEHEVDLIRDYLDLMGCRYPELRYSLDIDPELLEMEIPNFILQPVVENSLLHGLRDKGYRGCVNVRAFAEDDAHVLICVEDDGIGFSPDALDRVNRLLEQYEDDGSSDSSIGLRNVQNRLKMFYPPECGLSFSERAGGGVIAYIRVKRELEKGGAAR